MILAPVAALPPPGFETLSMVDLLRYQADHLDFCCVSTTVYLDLVLLYICRCVSAAVYIVLCILNYFCISTAVNMYPDLVLYMWLYICHCIYICHGVSTTMSAVLYICCCICRCVPAAVYPTLLSTTVYPTLVSAAVYPTQVSAAVYPTLVSAAVYLLLCILHCGSAVVYLPLCICHCVCCIVESDRVQRGRLNYLLYKSDYLRNHLMVESMPLYN